MRLIINIIFLVAAGISYAAPDGGQLYVTHCAVCHGDKGAGGVGIPLALPSFLESVDDAFLRKTMRYGRPGWVMPDFPALSDAQLNAIVGFILGWSGKPAPEFSYEPVKGDPVHGRELYVSYCAMCHGAWRRRQGHGRDLLAQAGTSDHRACAEKSRIPGGSFRRDDPAHAGVRSRGYADALVSGAGFIR